MKDNFDEAHAIIEDLHLSIAKKKLFRDGIKVLNPRI